MWRSFQETAYAIPTVAAFQHTLPPPLLGLPVEDPPPPSKPLCVRIAGFSLRATLAVPTADRVGSGPMTRILGVRGTLVGRAPERQDEPEYRGQ